MSGPLAASFGLEAGLLLAASEALLAAEAIADGHAQEEARQAAEQEQRRGERRRHQAAVEAGRQARAQQLAEREARLRRLADAWQHLGRGEASLDTSPPPPAPASDEALAGHLARLDARIAEFEAALRALSAQLAAGAAVELETLIAAGVSVEAQLAAYAARSRLAGGSAEAVEARRQTVARILERLELAEGQSLPAALDALAGQLVAADTGERAEALTMELRLQVHQHREAALAARRSADQQRLDAAAALVLEQSLKDLGYEVEEIAETLFVEGGVIHFQQPGWGDYHIRLRIAPERAAMNFNVVRAAGTGDDRKREDMLAEERWCAEFPKLFATLKARGIALNVTRLLQAGEVPVQLVDAASLPQRHEETRHSGRPLARTIE